ncbi:MAG: histidine phosphotransferase [Rubellimicrobium sp.]|nr:histidine phosphotransferase [Rubellimicrobium sp.]
MRGRGDLTALVGSRICHDLVGPMGAIGNGIELLGLTGATDGPEMALIAESVADANARLRFFRVAYGAAAPGQNMGRAEITATLAAVSRRGRVSFLWGAEGDQPRDEVRVVFLTLQCLESALPHGGEVQVTREAGGWTVTAESPRLGIVPALRDSLLDPRRRVEVGPAQVQFALLPEALSALGRKLVLTLAPERITLRF